MEADKVKALVRESSDYLTSLNHLTSVATLSSASSAGEWGKGEAADAVFLEDAGWHQLQDGTPYVNAKAVSQPAGLDRAGAEKASLALQRRELYFPTTDMIRFTPLFCVCYCASMN